MNVSDAASNIANNSNASSQTTDQSFKGLSSNFDTFLTLLTTQLQNQDPMNPMDSSQFTQQLVSYSQVEQAIDTNQNLQKLIDVTTTGATAESFSDLVGYLGKEVTMDTNTAGLKDGKAEWHYALDSQADAVDIQVTDANGRLVYQTTGETSPGDHTFTWDGTTSTGGTAPDGTYTIAVNGKLNGGSTVGTAVTVQGIVESAETEQGIHKLVINGTPIPLGTLAKVEPKTAENS
jgi:flagellar basal-body rod modification protein FlgD